MNPATAPEEKSFAQVPGQADRFRCYSRSALETQTSRLAGRGTMAAARTIVAAHDMPMGGRQEILFFDDDFGLVVSQLGFNRDFDYDFVHEDVSFFQFRLTGSSIERVSARHDPVLVDKPGFKFATRPSGHLESSRMLAGTDWHTVTPFIGAQASARLFGPEDMSLSRATASFGEWQSHSGIPLRGLSPMIRDVLAGIIACPLQGPLRHAYLEAKTIELICLVAARTNDDEENTPIISPRDHPRLEAARDIIEREFQDPPTLAEIGRIVGLNRRKLALGFREYFGNSVLQYCLAYRMRIARDLLDAGMSIAAVAQRTGYADQASFSRAFRRHHGTPPGSFSLCPE